MRSRSPAMVRAPWPSRVSRSVQLQKIDSGALADGRQVEAEFVLARRARHGGAHLSGRRRETAPRVALVADEQPAAGAAATDQQLKADLTLVQVSAPKGLPQASVR